MGNCAGTPAPKPTLPKTGSKVPQSYPQRYSSNYKPTNAPPSVNNSVSIKNEKPTQTLTQVLVGKKEQKNEANNYGNVRYESKRFESGALQKLGQQIKSNGNQISGQFNSLSRNIKDSYDTYGNVLKSSANQNIKGINDYQSGIKDSFNNISNKVIGQSNNLFNPQKLQQLNPTTKLAPILKDTLDNFYLPTAAPYPGDLKFNWALETSDQNFRLQPESVVIPSIDLKIS